MQDLEFRQLVQQVKDASPIEVIVGERVRLEKRGALLAARCPFHDEKTPSFYVDVRRQSWRCYGACAEGGDVIKFVERFDGMSFFESLELLATSAGIEIPRGGTKGGGSGSGQGDEDVNRPLFDALADAATWYREALSSTDGAAARAYLQDRDFTDETLARFGLGWAPERGNPITKAARRASAPAAWLKAGLVRRNDQGEGYDFFRGRLLIPIADRLGRVVGFGGRILPGDSSPAKYMNTAETPIFHKGKLIYGWHLAADAIRRERRVVLMEGYTDVMAAHQAGLEPVVAVLGTATTDEHARWIKRSGARVVTLVFDGDEAGRRAAKRAIVGLLPTGLEIRVAVPPEGKDPADVLLGPDGRAVFEASLESAEPWFEWMVRASREATGTADRTSLDPAGLTQAVDELLEMIQRIDSPVEQDATLVHAAESFGLSAESVRTQFKSLSDRQRVIDARARAREEREATEFREAEADSEAGANLGSDRRSPEMERLDVAYAHILGALLADNSLIPVYRDLREGCPAGPLARVFEVLLTTYDEDDVDPIDSNYLLTALAADPARDAVDRLVIAADMAETPAMLAADQASWLARCQEERELSALRGELAGKADVQLPLKVDSWAVPADGTPQQNAGSEFPSSGASSSGSSPFGVPSPELDGGQVDVGRSVETAETSPASAEPRGEAASGSSAAGAGSDLDDADAVLRLLYDRMRARSVETPSITGG